VLVSQVVCGPVSHLGEPLAGSAGQVHKKIEWKHRHGNAAAN